MPADFGEALSERELEIVSLVAQGLTNREIAARVFLSPNTVKVHLRNIFTKTGVASRTELTMLAVKEGWVAVVTVTQEEGGVPQLKPPPPEALSPEPEETVSLTETPATLPSPAPAPWPRERWIGLAVGVALMLLVLWLPQPRSTLMGGAPSAALVDLPVSSDGVASTSAETGWREVAPLPVRRARLGLAAFAGRLYAVGGLTAEGPSARLDIYNIQNDRWSEGASRPVALANIGAATLEGRILVPGGCDAQGQPAASVHAYDPVADVWETRSPLPTPLCGYALTVLDDRAYLFGGWDGQRNRAIALQYDPLTDAWETLPAPREARAFGAAAALGRELYYVGGYDGSEHTTCEVFLVDEERWERCPALLQPRGGLSLASVGGYLYAVGGGWGSYLGFNERYVPQQKNWVVAETPLVGEWRNLGLTVWETSLFAVGGWSGDFLNRTYVFDALPFRVFIPAP